MGSRGKPQATKIPAQLKTDDSFIPSGLAEYAAALHSIERELRAVQEKMESLRYALLSQNSGPTDLFALLAENARQFLTVEELAEALKVDRRTIYGLRGKGLPFYKVGKELRFDPLRVAEWLKKKH